MVWIGGNLSMAGDCRDRGNQYDPPEEVEGVMEQFCKEHSQFKPCQLCAKEDVWQGETLIFKRDAEKRIQSLEREIVILRQYLTDTSEDMECLDGCDSYGHEDDCPVTNPMAAFRKLRCENERLRELLSLARQACISKDCEARKILEQALEE